MDKFPDTFTRKTCIDKMTVKQVSLLKQTRKDFVDQVEKFTEETNPIMTLEFPERLWHEHKLTLIRELLEKFGKLKVKVVNPQAEVTKSIADVNDAPTNIRKVIIEFPLNDE